MKIILNLLLISSILCSFVYAETKEHLYKQQSLDTLQKKRPPKYTFGYIDRTHTKWEIAQDVGFAYALTWAIYPLSQPSVFKKKGSWKKYKDNFGEIVFDHDAPFWNVIVHPISGSQLYLYYRASGYSKGSALILTTISSALFEFTVEIYTEPASVPDLFHTPILGSMLGYGLENLSMYLLNTGNPLGRIFGHALNPFTLFWFYEGKMIITPDITRDGKGMISFYMDF